MTVGLPTNVAAALDELRSALAGAFGARMKRLVLFGSYARGRVHEDSDVDVLVLVDPSTPTDARRAAELATEVMLRRPEIVLAPLVMSVARLEGLRARERRFAKEIDEQGIAL